MKRYQIRPGVVMAGVCGEYMLVATRRARGCCPYVKQLNSTGAFYWSLLEAGKDMEAMIRTASDTYGVAEERIRPGVAAFLASLCAEGYLLEEGC